MIVTVQIAKVPLSTGLGILLRRPSPEDTPGLRYAETLFTAPLGQGLLPSPNLRTVALLASTGFGRLPRLVSTFSVWRSAGEMRDYAVRKGGAHRAAVERDRSRPFRRHSAFIRFRPHASLGSWAGRDPLGVA